MHLSAADQSPEHGVLPWLACGTFTDAAAAMEASADLRVKELLGEPADACLSLRGLI